MRKLMKLLTVMFALAICLGLMTPVTAEAAVKKPAKVTSLKKSSAASTSIKVTFKKATRAKGYQVQYSTKSSMKSAKTVKVTKTSATIKSLKTNTTYYVRVRAYNTSSKKKTQYGSWSSKVKIKTVAAKPAQVKSLEKTDVTETTLKVKYAKAARAEGYQIQYATNSKMTSAKTTKTTKASATLSGLKVGTTYYVRVRAYNTANSGKTQYGSWSKKITVETWPHTWVNSASYEDVYGWNEYQLVYVGVKDTATGTIYPDYWAFEDAFKARCNTKPVCGDFYYIYETQITYYPLGTEPFGEELPGDNGYEYAEKDIPTGKIYINPAEYTAANKEYNLQLVQNHTDGSEITAEPSGNTTTMADWHWWREAHSIATHPIMVCTTCGATK